MEDMAAELYAHGGMMRPSLSIIEDGCNSHMYDYEANTTYVYSTILLHLLRIIERLLLLSIRYS